MNEVREPVIQRRVQEEKKGEVFAACPFGQFLRQVASLTGRFTPGGNEIYRLEPPFVE